jgi:DNA-directed RNA polymerase specialized sigma24 family protein
MPDDTSDFGKIANLLALMVTQDMARSTAAVTLQACGFSYREIAALTGSAENSVRAMISAAKKKGSGEKATKETNG